MEAVRRTIQRVDAALPIISARSIEEQMAPLTAQDRSTAQLAVAFGGVALMLAAIGLYGVLRMESRGARPKSRSGSRWEPGRGA